MQIKSAILSLTILSAVFVNAAPHHGCDDGFDCGFDGEVEADSLAGGLGGLIGSGLAFSGPVSENSKNTGAVGNAGITANAPIENPDILKNINLNLAPQLNLPIASHSESEMRGSEQEIDTEERRGDRINTD